MSPDIINDKQYPKLWAFYFWIWMSLSLRISRIGRDDKINTRRAFQKKKAGQERELLCSTRRDKKDSWRRLRRRGGTEYRRRLVRAGLRHIFICGLSGAKCWRRVVEKISCFSGESGDEFRHGRGGAVLLCHMCRVCFQKRNSDGFWTIKNMKQYCRY